YANAACGVLGAGEGQHFIGTANVVTDATCFAPINVTLSAAVSVGEVVTATATSLAGDTSEFSACTLVVPASRIITCAPDQTVASAANQCGARVDYKSPAPFGSCGPVECAPPQGSVFPLGTTAVTCAASAGPVCSFNISVVDTTPPVIVCPGDIVTGLGAGQQ